MLDREAGGENAIKKKSDTIEKKSGGTVSLKVKKSRTQKQSPTFKFPKTRPRVHLSRFKNQMRLQLLSDNTTILELLSNVTLNAAFKDDDSEGVIPRLKKEIKRLEKIEEPLRVSLVALRSRTIRHRRLRDALIEKNKVLRKSIDQAKKILMARLAGKKPVFEDEDEESSPAAANPASNPPP